jgi:hypothetical protein
VTISPGALALSPVKWLVAVALAELGLAFAKDVAQRSISPPRATEFDAVAEPG